MIENYLTEMGIAGVWIITMLYDRQVFQKRMEKVIANNTRAMSDFKHTIQKCKKGGVKNA